MPKPLEGVRVMDLRTVILSGKSSVRRTKAKNLTSSLKGHYPDRYTGRHKEVLRGQRVQM